MQANFYIIEFITASLIIIFLILQFKKKFMEQKISRDAQADVSADLAARQVSRRKFFNYAGVSATAMMAAASCRKGLFPDILPSDPKGVPKVTENLGSGDIGILNYAYALEQLEVAFYTRVASSFYSGATEMEMHYLEDIRDHEIAHREFLKQALGQKSIGTLILDFSSINFNSRDSVLKTAKAFEDLGVSAYNGAGELIQSAEYLLLAGKIVSVEARHAAALRGLLDFESFAGTDVVDAQGLDMYRKPPEVLGIAGQYILTRINANNLPTS